MKAPACIGSETADARTLRRLRELIVALDRRAPQVHRAGEAGIARTGNELQAAAQRRIAELERGGTAARSFAKTR